MGSASLRAPGMAAEEERPAIRAARAFDAGFVEDARRAIEAGGEEDARTLANVAVLDYVSKIPREAGDEASLLERLRGAEGALARETSTSSESLELASHDSYALRVNTAFALQMLGRDEESANILEGLFADAESADDDVALRACVMFIRALRRTGRIDRADAALARTERLFGVAGESVDTLGDEPLGGSPARSSSVAAGTPPSSPSWLRSPASAPSSPTRPDATPETEGGELGLRHAALDPPNLAGFRAWARLERARLALDAGDRERAARLLDGLEARVEDEGEEGEAAGLLREEVRFVRARERSLAGAHAEAMRLLTDATIASERDPNALANLARALAENGADALAGAVLREAAKRANETKAGSTTVAAVAYAEARRSYASGSYERAETLFRECAETPAGDRPETWIRAAESAASRAAFGARGGEDDGGDEGREGASSRAFELLDVATSRLEARAKLRAGEGEAGSERDDAAASAAIATLRAALRLDAGDHEAALRDASEAAAGIPDAEKDPILRRYAARASELILEAKVWLGRADDVEETLDAVIEEYLDAGDEGSSRQGATLTRLATELLRSGRDGENASRDDDFNEAVRVAGAAAAAAPGDKGPAAAVARAWIAMNDPRKAAEALAEARRVRAKKGGSVFAEGHP